MINPFAETNWNPDFAARRAFGKSLIIGFPIVALVFLAIGRVSHGSWPTWPLWLLGIGVAVGLLCWALPSVAKPLYVVWYGLGCCVGIVVANVVVGAIFYLVVTPTGLLMRCFGKDPMERRLDREAGTYWKNAEPSVDKGRYFRQF